MAAVVCGCGGGGGGAESGGGNETNGIVVQLAHQAVAFDPSRQIYYATVTADDPVRGNRIATIDRNGAVTTSAPIGSSLGAVAVSKDGTRLYVGHDATGEVAQYALPGFSLLAKITLPSEHALRPAYAEHITVSAIDPNVFAVSLAYKDLSPRHGGVALVKNMVILPDRTPSLTGSNRLAFGPSGDAVYGFTNESTAFGVRKMLVTPTGLVQHSVTSVTSVPGANFSWDIDAFGDFVMVGSQAYTASTMAARAVVAGASFHCVGIAAGAKVACFSRNYGSIIVAETVSFTRVGELTFPETAETPAYKLIAGPAGQVAASASGSSRIYLINGDTLR